MNNQRRQEIADLISYIKALKGEMDGLLNKEIRLTYEYGPAKKKRTARTEVCSILGHLEKIKEDIEDVKNQEEEYKDNLPENLQNGEKADQSDTAITQLEEAVGYIDEMVDMFGEDMTSKLDEAVGSLEAIE